MNRKQLIILAVVVSLLYAFGIGYAITKNNNLPCDKTITLNDGTVINMKKTYSDENGLTKYRDCNDEWIEIPTVNIKEIRADKY